MQGRSVGRVINIGVHTAIVEDRQLALQNAGHKVHNALTLRELEQQLRLDHCDVIVVGHSLTPSEKLRAHTCAKQWNNDCPIVEIFIHAPDLPSATAHVPFDAGITALLAAVEGACGHHSR
ncbi:MAG TPA: hypothetical protein VGC88_11150 [Terriglobales bacterium]